MGTIRSLLTLALILPAGLLLERVPTQHRPGESGTDGERRTMGTDTQESTAWRHLRDALPGARDRADALIRRSEVQGGDDLAGHTLAELGTALEGLSVALAELDQQHAMVRELQNAVDGQAGRGREVFDAMPSAVVVTDSRGLIVEANGAGMRLLRQTTGFLRGKPLAAFVAEGRRSDFYGLLEGAGEGQGSARGELPFRTDADRAHRVQVAPAVLAGRPALYWLIEGAPSAPATAPATRHADTAAPAAVGPRTGSPAEELEAAKALAAQLQHALDSRVVIEQAKGRLAERLGITETDAFEILRRHVRSTGTKLSEAAEAVVSGELDLP